MQTLRPSHVPEYLRTSSFYLGLNLAEDDEFSVLTNCMKRNTQVQNLDDFVELLNTIRFWGSEFTPHTVFTYAAHQRHKLINTALEPFRSDLPFLSTVCSIASKHEDTEMRVEKAMESGNLSAVQYFHCGGPFSDRAIALAAGKGALDCLQYALTFGVTGKNYGQYLFSEAVRNGCMDSILFLRQKGFHLDQNFYYSCLDNGEDLVKIASSMGHCDVLKYLHSQGCSIKSAAVEAADADQFDCLEYAMQNGAILRGENSYTSASRSLAQRLAHLKQPRFLALALSRGSMIDTQTALKCAKSGSWLCFKHCVQHVARPSLHLIAVAVENGQLDSLKCLHKVCFAKATERGGGTNWLTYAAGNSRGWMRPADVAQMAASARQWNCLRFLITHHCPMCKALTTSLVQAGQLELYHLATAHGCEVSVRAACEFAKAGNLVLLQHALEHGCERSEEILRAAARHGQLQCLIHAYAQGCPWRTPISLSAARGGHLECLKYLDEFGTR